MLQREEVEERAIYNQLNVSLQLSDFEISVGRIVVLIRGSIWTSYTPSGSVPDISAKYFVRKEMFYLTTHSTHFIYSYIASDIW